MAVLSVLPPELVLQIFSRIKYEDRFETCKVSYEWFFLTLKTYKNKMTSKNDLLVSMADFFNKAMGAKKYSSWMQLFRYMKSKKAEISSSDSPAFIKAVDKCKPYIQVIKMDMGQFLTEFWKSYPNLQSVDVRSGFAPDSKVSILKDAFGSLFIPQVVNQQITGHCTDFRLKRFDSTYALSMVVLTFREHSSSVLATALTAIKESKTVNTFVIINPVITSKWNKLFPSSVRRLVLMDPVIKDAVVPQIKDLLFFLCKDWTLLTHFKIRQFNVIKYQCFPRKKLETFYIVGPEIPPNFTNGFQFSRVMIDGLQSVDYLKESLPASVISLQLVFGEFPKQFSPKKLFSRSPNLETLSIIMPSVNNFYFGDFTGLPSLHTLFLSFIGPKMLESIFLSLPSLELLATEMTEEGTFTRLPRKEVVSKSLKILTLRNTSVSNSFILRHVKNLKGLSIDDYDPKKHQFGFLCSSYYNMDLVMITGKFDPLLCRAIGSELADYPYKCIVAQWRFESNNYIYVLSRKLQPLRNSLITKQPMCLTKSVIYVHGFSVAFLQKMHNLVICFDVEQFLSFVNWSTCKSVHQSKIV